MSRPSSARRPSADDAASDTGPRDEVGEHRARRARARGTEDLSELDREEYELQLDAYEVQVAEYRMRLSTYAAELELAHHDELTGAWLRQAGRRLFHDELNRADRLGTPLSIGFVDVDGLKAINDQFGHAAGDRALTTVAQALLVGLRGYDHVVRWGGDEFLCVLPGLTQQDATRRLEQAQHLLAAGDQQLSISVGVAEYEPAEPFDALVSRADQALYRSRGRHLRT